MSAWKGEVDGCTQRVQTAWPCLGSALERHWSALDGPFFYALLGLENSPLTL